MHLNFSYTIEIKQTAVVQKMLLISECSGDGE